MIFKQKQFIKEKNVPLAFFVPVAFAFWKSLFIYIQLAYSQVILPIYMFTLYYFTIVKKYDQSYNNTKYHPIIHPLRSEFVGLSLIIMLDFVKFLYKSYYTRNSPTWSAFEIEIYAVGFCM
jgi:hypothetical protein